MLINETLPAGFQWFIVGGSFGISPMPAYKITALELDYTSDWEYEDLTQDEMDTFNKNFIGKVFVVDEEEELTDAVTNATYYCINSIQYEQIPSVEVTLCGMYCGEVNETHKRFEVPIKGKKTDLAVVRAVKSALGWNNIRCHKQEYGDSIRLVPAGILQCADIEVVY